MNANSIAPFLERENNKFYHVMINNDCDSFIQKYQIQILCGYYDITPIRNALTLRLVYKITSNITAVIDSLSCYCDYSINFNQSSSAGILHISCENFIKRLNERTHDIFPSNKTVYILMTKQKTLSFLGTVPFLIQTNGWKINDEFMATWNEMITKIH